MDTYIPLFRALLVIALIGVPTAAIYWTWKGIKKKEMSCPCGGQITPLGGHGPCGCRLDAQPIQAKDLEERRAKGYN